ncbi:alkaline phosphatase D family protein [Nocardioides lentus]|uniref:Alkaline phosphatase D family protein n=1 Tax=Nocardioides lentus TaxID=338077 RepID=A0ABN2PSX1_9ACTN
MTSRPDPVDRRTVLRTTGLAAAASVAATSGLLAPLAAGGPAVAAPTLVRGGRPRLTHGVQSGDVRAGGAVVWSRADRRSRLMVEVSRDPRFRGARTVRGPVVGPGSDFTGHVDLSGLPRGTELHYRVRAVDLDDPRRASEPVVGRLRTVPGRRDDVRFLWSGDIAGQGWGVNPEYGGFRIADAMTSRDADFFLCSGDYVYADGPVAATVALPDGSTWRNETSEAKAKVAETLAEFRGQYAYNLTADNWRRFLARTPQVVQWDDHEVTNNWYPGEILDDDRYRVKDVDTLARRGHRAFHEWTPLSDVSPDPDGRIYRVIHYGPLLDVFVLDMRTFKNPNTPNLEPAEREGVLGRRQTRWLLRELERSTATWKVVAADLPIGLLVPDGEDWEGIANGDDGAPLGREQGIATVLAGLQRLGIRNHVWLTADVHHTAAHHYSPDRAAFQAFDPFWEFVSGPLNAGAFPAADLDGTFGPRKDFVSSPEAANVSPAEGFQFFGEVEIDAGSRDLTVHLRDVDGRSIYSRTLRARRR